MNGFSITPFRGLHLLLLLLTAAAALLIFLLLRKKPEARRSRLLIGMCLFNLALFTVYKLSLSMDAAYIRAYYPNGFNIFNELPLHLCNINLFLIPIGLWKRNRSIMGFSFFVAPLGALMALLFPEPLFSGFSLFLPRIFGYYVTHALLVVCGLSLATLGFYRPDPKDIPQILKTFGLLAVGAHLINLLLRLTQQDIRKGGLRRAGEGTRSTEPKKEREQRLTGALPGRIHRAPRARLFHIPAR